MDKVGKMERENAMLILERGSGPGRRWSLDRESYLIGRLPDCDIILPDRSVSRRHARIYLRGDRYWIEDLGSKNGTYINGEPLTEPRPLDDGDEIQIALRFKMAFVGAEETAPLDLEQAGRLRLDRASHDVYIRERKLTPPLSQAQYRLLEALSRAEGKVVSRDELISAVWPGQEAGVTDQALDALVRRLRERLAEVDPDHRYVATVRGHGFRLDNE